MEKEALNYLYVLIRRKTAAGRNRRKLQPREKEKNNEHEHKLMSITEAGWLSFSTITPSLSIARNSINDKGDQPTPYTISSDGDGAL